MGRMASTLAGRSLAIRKEREEKLYAATQGWFANHALLHRHEDDIVSTYVIGIAGSSTYRAEVYVGWNAITVQGDIDLMSFGGGPKLHRQRISWLAHATNGYLKEKASIGCTWQGVVEEHDDEIALHDLMDLRRNRSISKEAARAAMDVLDGCGSAQEATQAIHEMEYAENADLGDVISQRVITAHSAVKALHRLLELAEGRLS